MTERQWMRLINDDYLAYTLGQYLFRRLGERNAIRSKDLSGLFGISGVTVRAKVHKLRTMGVPICSGAEGYWYAETDAEVRATIGQLRSRVKHILEAVEGLDNYINPSRDEERF